MHEIVQQNLLEQLMSAEKGSNLKLHMPQMKLNFSGMPVILLHANLGFQLPLFAA